jgi:hypothetical protein
MKCGRTTFSGAIHKSVELLLAQGFLLMVPIGLTVDLFGRAHKLGTLILGIRDVEEDLERLCGTPDMEERQVMRLVSEYNCQVAMGIPIHNWVFKRWHDEIKEMWVERSK